MKYITRVAKQRNHEGEIVRLELMSPEKTDDPADQDAKPMLRVLINDRYIYNLSGDRVKDYLQRIQKIITESGII